MVTSASGYISSTQKFKQVELLDGQLLSEVEVPGEFVNKTLKELNLRARFGVEVILIKQHYDTQNREKEKVILIRPDYRFQLGDTLLLMASRKT